MVWIYSISRIHGVKKGLSPSYVINPRRNENDIFIISREIERILAYG